MEFAVLHNDRSVTEIMRLIGYKAARFNKAGEFWVVRRLGKNEYPRFHLYGLKENTAILLKLHLDRVKPLLGDILGHGGEGEGKTVEEEMKRIKSSLKDDLTTIHN